MKKRHQKLLLILLVVVFIAVNYSFMDRALQKWFSNYEVGVVERVIDGDTIVVNGTSVRLLGINTPEKGERYYAEAKEFLEKKVLGSVVRLESGKEDIDRYHRKLRYVYTGGENINLEIVKNGYANYYFPSGKDKYYNDFKQAWEKCLSENKNICEKSLIECGRCIGLNNFDVKNQAVELKNLCSFSCNLENWTIKDEGRKVFVFPNYVLTDKVEVKIGNGEDSSKILYWAGEEYVWTDSGDTLFLRDNEDKLVLWRNY